MSEAVVKVSKLVHGGQALGELDTGRKVFVWGALPGETVRVRLLKSKRSYAQAVVEEVLEASDERIEPRDKAYLSTSPWQVMTFEAENAYKRAILEETLQREKVNYNQEISFHAGNQQWQYRNKMEYSFWADETGLSLALFRRGTHGKQTVQGSSIARPEIDETANKICKTLESNDIRGSQLKTVVVRCNRAGETVAALFVKDESFPELTELSSICKGAVVYYSTPKSPASVTTKELYSFGDIRLSDSILGTEITYDVNSFFQVNVPVFESVLKRIDHFIGDCKAKIDFYSGVGTIGLPVGATVLVDSDIHNIEMAKQNVGKQPVDIIHASAESALEHIPKEGALIVDPPRAGLHPKVVDKILTNRPDTIAYLSCNPITQARDLALLQEIYEIRAIEGYNFFPRTPHIESLAILVNR